MFREELMLRSGVSGSEVVCRIFPKIWRILKISALVLSISSSGLLSCQATHTMRETPDCVVTPLCCQYPGYILRHSRAYNGIPS